MSLLVAELVPSSVRRSWFEGDCNVHDWSDADFYDPAAGCLVTALVSVLVLGITVSLVARCAFLTMVTVNG